MNIEPVDYVLKFHKDFYYPIYDQYKITTIRRESKPLNIGDYCFADFIDSDGPHHHSGSHEASPEQR